MPPTPCSLDVPSPLGLDMDLYSDVADLEDVAERDEDVDNLAGQTDEESDADSSHG